MGRGCTEGPGCLPTAPQLPPLPPQGGSCSPLSRNGSGRRNLGTLLGHCSICAAKESQPLIFLHEIQAPLLWIPAGGGAEGDRTPLRRHPHPCKQGWSSWAFAGVQHALGSAGSQGVPSSWQAQLPPARMGKHWQLPLKCFGSPRSESHGAALPPCSKHTTDKRSSFSLCYLLGVGGGGRSSARGWVFPGWCQRWAPGRSCALPVWGEREETRVPGGGGSSQER